MRFLNGWLAVLMIESVLSRLSIVHVVFLLSVFVYFFTIGCAVVIPPPPTVRGREVVYTMFQKKHPLILLAIS